jgi:hypothetical protein
MSLADGFINVPNLGTGEPIATVMIGGKRHQLVTLAGPRGHIWGSADCFIADTGFTANVAASRTTHVDLFNASGSGVVLEIHGIFIIGNQAVVTGVGQTWEIIRTTAVGTGGTSITPRALDTDNAALPAQVTARTKPTGGATTNHILTHTATSTEETSGYAGMSGFINHLSFAATPDVQNVVLREGQGLKIDQTTNSSVGSNNIRVVFSVK